MYKGTYKLPICDPGRCSKPRGHLGLCENIITPRGLPNSTNTRNHCFKGGLEAHTETASQLPEVYRREDQEKETARTGESDACTHAPKKLRPASPECKTDVYYSMAKEAHRAEFAISTLRAWRNYLEDGGDPDAFRVLYLETAAAAATKDLLRYGLPEHTLFPCNKNPLELEGIQAAYPGVHTVVADIYDAFKTNTFHAVWFDTEETWLDLDKPNQDWKHGLIPKFWEATVAAISLSCRRVQGGPGDFANELQKLIEAKGGTLHQGVRDYKGRSGVTNMIFGVATFASKLPPASHYFLKKVHVPLSRFAGWTANTAYEKVALANGVAGIVGIVTGWTDESKKHALINYKTIHGHFFENADVDCPLGMADVRKYCVEM